MKAEKVEPLAVRQKFMVVREVVQIGPEHWEQQSRVMAVTTTTTVRDILLWAEQFNTSPGMLQIDFVIEAQ